MEVQKPWLTHWTKWASAAAWLIARDFTPTPLFEPDSFYFYHFVQHIFHISITSGMDQMRPPAGARTPNTREREMKWQNGVNLKAMWKRLHELIIILKSIFILQRQLNVKGYQCTINLGYVLFKHNVKQVSKTIHFIRHLKRQ